MNKRIKKNQFLTQAECKLKRIWDVLCDKRIVGFTLSMKFYRNEMVEPKTICMQGKRMANTDWDTSFVKDPLSPPLHSPDHLKKCLDRIARAVQDYIVENELDADWKKQEASLKAKLKLGLSIEDLEWRSEIPVRAIAAYGYDAHFGAPIMATAYVMSGKDALAKNDFDRASHCVERGLYWSSPGSFIADPGKRFSERASTGGDGKDLRRDPVKDKVAELLIALAPEKGWECTWAGIEVVADELIFKYANLVEASLLKPDNLPRTIEGWVRAEPGRFPHRLMADA